MQSHRDWAIAWLSSIKNRIPNLGDMATAQNCQEFMDEKLRPDEHAAFMAARVCALTRALVAGPKRVEATRLATVASGTRLFP